MASEPDDSGPQRGAAAGRLRRIVSARIRFDRIEDRIHLDCALDAEGPDVGLQLTRHATAALLERLGRWIEHSSASSRGIESEPLRREVLMQEHLRSLRRGSLDPAAAEAARERRQPRVEGAYALVRQLGVRQIGERGIALSLGFGREGEPPLLFELTRDQAHRLAARLAQLAREHDWEIRSSAVAWLGEAAEALDARRSAPLH